MALVPIALNVTVGVQNTGPVDIILCRGKNAADAESYSKPLMAALERAGVDPSRVRITEPAALSYVSGREGLQQMIDDFYVTPTGIQPPRIIDISEVGDTLVGPGDEVMNDGLLSMEGLISTETYDNTVNIHAMSRVFCISHGIVIAPRLDIDKNGVIKQGYFVTLGTNHSNAGESQDESDYYDMSFRTDVWECPKPEDDYWGPAQGYVKLVYVHDVKLTDVRHRLNTLHAPPGRSAVVAISEKIPWEYTPYCPRGWKTFPYSSERQRWSTWDHVELDISLSGDNIRVSTKDYELINYTMPPDRIIPKGSVGYSSANILHGGLSEISFKMGNLVPLVTSVRSADWRPNSDRFVFHLKPYDNDDFSTQDVGELVQRMGADGAYYMSLNTWSPTYAGMGSYSDLFLEHYNGRGKNFLTNNIFVWDSIARYIENIVNRDLTGKDAEYLVKDKEYLYTPIMN